MARDKQALKKGTSVVGGVVLEWSRPGPGDGRGDGVSRSPRHTVHAAVGTVEGALPWASAVLYCTHLFTCTVKILAVTLDSSEAQTTDRDTCVVIE